jgi:hypothetical protein
MKNVSSGRLDKEAKLPIAMLAFAFFGAVAAADEPPRVFLNHFYVVVDAASYRALQESPFMTEQWAPFEKRTTARNDRTYTGVYWYGRRTYFEVFEPDGQGPAGSSGLALGVEGPGESAAVKTLWAAVLGDASTSVVTRKTETDEAPWFHMTYTKSAPETLRVWLMEYHADFLSRWYPELTPARGISRAEVLDRYVAKIGRSRQRETALFQDLTGLVIALAPAERDTLVRHLRAVGWTARDEEEAVVLEGPENVALRLLPSAAGRRGILEAGFSLQPPSSRREATFGSVALTLENGRGRLRFAP